MSFEGEFASYEPLRRMLDSKKVQALNNRMRVIKPQVIMEHIKHSLVYKKDVISSKIQPDLVLAIDGSYLEAKVINGFPCAEQGYVTVAAVLIDTNLIKQLEKNEFINPKDFRKTEKTSTLENVFPGANVILDSEDSAKSSFRRSLYESLKNEIIFTEGESLLDTYEYLLKMKLNDDPQASKPQSPLDEVEQEMTYGIGEYKCPYTNKSLFSTDALRLHELMKPNTENGELFGQTMATMEKLLLVHILRAFEKKKWLSTLRRVAFIIDGPLAVFSTSSWLTKVIEKELKRINELQKHINGEDLLIIGIEKSGTFFNHFLDIDISKEGVQDKFPRQSALLLTDDYIKKNIIFSKSQKPYGQDTYFGRKIFYKAYSGQKIVAVIAWFNEYQKNIKTAESDQITRLGDVMNLLDQLASNRYPNSILPLISAHAEAAIPLNIGKQLFENIAREIKDKE